MKILRTRIKKWSFKQRLFEIERRLKTLQEMEGRKQPLTDEVDECLQIVRYWMEHMAGEVDPVSEVPKKKKSVNLW
jgi:hypothetical protein